MTDQYFVAIINTKDHIVDTLAIRNGALKHLQIVAYVATQLDFRRTIILGIN